MRVLFANWIGTAASSGDEVQILWQAQYIVRISFLGHAGTIFLLLGCGIA
jgi:hypothetical protein